MSAVGSTLQSRGGLCSTSGRPTVRASSRQCAPRRSCQRSSVCTRAELSAADEAPPPLKLHTRQPVGMKPSPESSSRNLAVVGDLEGLAYRVPGTGQSSTMEPATQNDPLRQKSLIPTEVLENMDTKFIQKAAMEQSVRSFSPSFVHPVGIRRHLPLFIFLPGLDGSGLLIWNQLKGLMEHYDIRCLSIPPTDRSSYAEIADIVAKSIAEERSLRGAAGAHLVWRGLGGPDLDSFFRSCVILCPSNHFPGARCDVQPVTVAGESFTGPLALVLGARHPKAADNLIIINSGSAFRRQPLLFYGSGLLPLLPEQLMSVSSFGLAPFLSSWNRLADANRALIVPPFSTDLVPKDTVVHRLRCMSEFIMTKTELGRIEARVLLIASGKDRLLPSVPEANRLALSIRRAMVHVVPDAGHAVLLEEETSLVEIISGAGMLPTRVLPLTWARTGLQDDSGLGSIADAAILAADRASLAARDTARVAAAGARAVAAAGILRSSPGDAEAAASAAEAVTDLISTVDAARSSARRPPLPGAGDGDAALAKRSESVQLRKQYHRDLTSEEALTGDVAGAAITRMVEELPAYRLWNWLTRPVMYGTENIPDERPLLFVGNHTMYGIYDMPLMVYELKKRKGIVLRGLAHPLHYASAFGDLLARYGAVKATPRNYFKLLEAGEAVLLYPGGAREVAKRKGEENKLLWKEDTDFVRLAMRFGCTIVPFAALGVDDAFGIAFDSKDIMNSPLGDPIKRAIHAAGFPADSGMDVADAVPPIALGMGGLPFVPNAQRLYFHFGKPIRTDGFTPAEVADKEKCSQLYTSVRKAVEDGITVLQTKRDEDPIRELLPRMLLNVFEGWDGK